jgi:hypothetical protein
MCCSEYPIGIAFFSVETSVCSRKILLFEGRFFTPAMDAGNASVKVFHQYPFRAGNRIGIHPPQMPHVPKAAPIVKQVRQIERITAFYRAAVVIAEDRARDLIAVEQQLAFFFPRQIRHPIARQLKSHHRDRRQHRQHGKIGEAALHFAPPAPSLTNRHKPFPPAKRRARRCAHREPGPIHPIAESTNRGGRSRDLAACLSDNAVRPIHPAWPDRR